MSRFIFFLIYVQLFWHYLLKRLHFLFVFFSPLSNINLLYLYVSISGLYFPLLIYMSIILPTPHCLAYCSIIAFVMLRVINPNLSFSSNALLVILGLLFPHLNLRINFPFTIFCNIFLILFLWTFLLSSYFRTLILFTCFKHFTIRYPHTVLLFL